MHFVRVNRRILSLSHLILCEQVSDNPPRVRIVMETGVTIDEEGEDVVRLVEKLDELASLPVPTITTTIAPRPSPGEPRGSTGQRRRPNKLGG